MAKGKVTAQKLAAKDQKKQKQEVKAAKKKMKEMGCTENQDIETLLKAFDDKKPSSPSSTVFATTPPSPRAACSMVLSPVTGEFIMFGGEFYDGQKAQVYRDLYKFHPEKGEWKKVEFSKGPKPRCSHQAVVYKEQMLVFGGEFATAEQFYHFKDLWSLDLKSLTWTELSSSGQGPTARSGHRMVVWRNYLVVFGGFHDTFRETRYFNDLFLLNLHEMRWRKVLFSPHVDVPSPRSGCQMAVHVAKDSILLYGGYSKVKDNSRCAQGVVHKDAWWLNLRPLVEQKDAIPVWERLSARVSQAPSARSSAAMTVHKNMAILFGGVFDDDDGQINLRSMFYNDLYGFDLERRRWYHLELRAKGTSKGAGRGKAKGKAGASLPPPPSQKEQTENNCEEEDVEVDDDSDVENTTFGYIDLDGKLVRIPLTEFETEEVICEPAGGVEMADSKMTDETDPVTSDRKEEEGKETHAAPSQSLQGESPLGNDVIKESNEIPPPSCAFSPDLDRPLPRINPCLAVKGGFLYVYGGIVEVGKRSYTLDDLWRLHLNQRQQWECIWRGTIDQHPWNEIGSDDEDADLDEDITMTDEEDTEETTSEESDCEMLVNDTVSENGDMLTPMKQSQKKKRVKDRSKPEKLATLREEMARLKAMVDMSDPKRIPEVGESLRAFFERTKEVWANEARQIDPEVRVSSKELYRSGFLLAEKQFQEVEPYLKQIENLEKEQKKLEN